MSSSACSEFALSAGLIARLAASKYACARIRWVLRWQPLCSSRPSKSRQPEKISRAVGQITFPDAIMFSRDR